MQGESKPGLRRQQHFRSNETVDQNFLKQKNQPTKISYPGGMLRGSLNLVIYDPVQKQAQTSKVIDLLNSEILIFKNF